VATYRADWILPITTRPIEGGWVRVEGGRIAGLGAGTLDGARDLGRTAVLPSLVNAHTHLELSYLAGTVPPASRFVDWIRRLIAARQRYPDPRDPEILQAARTAIGHARASGTGLIGDISNTLVTVPLLHDAGMPGRVFYELLGFNTPDAAGQVQTARVEAAAAQRTAPQVSLSLAAHAPYSVSPQLFAAIRADLDAHDGDITSVHLAESAEEVEFLRHGSGPWADVLREVGAWTESWRHPERSPVGYLAGMGFLDSRVIAVHAVQCSPDDLAHLRKLGTTVVSCPRSNRYVGVGDPPLQAFYATDLSVAFGTDSLASVEDLNMFAELAAARKLADNVAARHLLESATLVGARALGFAHELGSIEVGKMASLIAVRMPDHVSDVEEYLVGGIQPTSVNWLDSHP
jgi:cytosine/adenosine deaminase-related metal-dependent hydrolase